MARATITRAEGSGEAPNFGTRSHERPGGHRPQPLVPLLSVLEQRSRTMGAPRRRQSDSRGGRLAGK